MTTNPMTADIHLSPSEAARKLGVTPKALRLYERDGLVTPIRTSNGYRAYGPTEMAKLHQVLALKGLALHRRSHPSDLGDDHDRKTDR